MESLLVKDQSKETKNTLANWFLVFPPNKKKKNKGILLHVNFIVAQEHKRQAT